MTIENQPKNTLVFTLTYLGLLPFIACTMFSLFGHRSLAMVGSVHAIFSYYACVIVSFMAGIHWGIAISQSSNSMLPIYSSILIAIVAWLIASYASFIFSCVAYAFLFCLCLCVDRFLLQSMLISEAYFLVRVRVTMVVIVCMSIMGMISVWR